MGTQGTPPFSLSPAEIQSFIDDGFVRIDAAFSPQCAAEARAILWRDTGCAPDEPSTWTRPVIRLGQYGQPPFREAANTPVLHRAFDQLAGAGRWRPLETLGTFPVRFPAPADPGDTGWHIDPSFGYEHPDFLEWRANVTSQGRALLLLFLFSDIGPDDAPTRIRRGSHLEIARQLEPAGAPGLTLRALAADGFASSSHCPETLATGQAGTVYVCHPFLVHAAQSHRGRHPRFLAQPPLLPREPLKLEREDAAYSPVELAIRKALA
ncbi:phytanoyl-CoA dioxygenase family protein [Paludibaculum fermentans]|uniref:Phytanoyl-CoA dioxygenase family protein n=1 Tax=Paludibaculum fermentans TaxID=1473598 RepID=A0A7S7SNA8_PALFE|nr:phytanoyl-CoA dioxygenase family protein [Paludibaculum fermentans]QOY90366.1 phytanoyl-CoA dioxygenase family protein [Paludibaculum fermentans]